MDKFSMNNKTAIAIIVAVVLIVGAFFYGRHEGNTQSLMISSSRIDASLATTGSVCAVLAGMEYCSAKICVGHFVQPPIPKTRFTVP